MYVYKYSLNLTFLSASCKYCIKAQDQVQTYTSSTSQEFTGRSRSWVCTLTCPDQTLCTEVYIPTYFNKYRRKFFIEFNSTSGSSPLSTLDETSLSPQVMCLPTRATRGLHYTSNTSRSCSSSNSRSCGYSRQQAVAAADTHHYKPLDNLHYKAPRNGNPISARGRTTRRGTNHHNRGQRLKIKRAPKEDQKRWRSWIR